MIPAPLVPKPGSAAVSRLLGLPSAVGGRYLKGYLQVTGLEAGNRLKILLEFRENPKTRLISG